MMISPIQKTIFCGKFIDGTWFTDEETNLANRFRNVENWEEIYKDEFKESKKIDIQLEHQPWGSILNDLTLGYHFHSKMKHALENEFQIKLSRLRALMVKMNNQDILREKRKALKIAAITNKEQFNNDVLSILNNRFFKLLDAQAKGKEVKVPTGIMIEKGSLSEREDTIALIKEKSGCHIIETTHENDEDATIYRIETELENAKERYNTSGIRTILCIENFHKMLMPKETSEHSISRLKNLLSDMGNENSPLTILFHTDNTSGILDAFLVNNTRIPLKINLKEIKSAQTSKN